VCRCNRLLRPEYAVVAQRTPAACHGMSSAFALNAVTVNVSDVGGKQCLLHC
jgi:hypothetical protein